MKSEFLLQVINTLLIKEHLDAARRWEAKQQELHALVPESAGSVTASGAEAAPVTVSHLSPSLGADGAHGGAPRIFIWDSQFLAKLLG
jgi:hypothetical protein